MQQDVGVLGTIYSIESKTKEEDNILNENGIAGYCDEVDKRIVLLDLSVDEDYKDESDEYRRLLTNSILRHEIVHAFLNESGLSYNSLSCNESWAKNEEMVDWIALQFPKLLKAFKETNCI